MSKSIKYEIYPGKFKSALDEKLAELSSQDILKRVWEHDYTLWNDKPDEITNRLDWLTLPETMTEKLEEMAEFVEDAVQNGFKKAVLLGMGGSSLAPDVFRRVFDTQAGHLELMVLDTTDAAFVSEAAKNLEIPQTLFIVSTKSGGTVETLSLFKYFYNLTLDQVGSHTAGSHFVAITDPGSRLEKLAGELKFRKAFLNNPNLGGRYSALSYFGLVPAALMGIDIKTLLANAKVTADNTKSETSLENNIAVKMGVLLGTAASQGVDKLTFLSDQKIAALEDWIEQLIAESTGKSGTGILPVAGEALPSDLANYSKDRIFANLGLGENPHLLQVTKNLVELGFPVIQITIDNLNQLGGMMYLWEVATAIAGKIINIHPFNQPNVEAAKKLARQTVETYQQTGNLPESNSIKYNPEQILNFLEPIYDSSYIAIQAFTTPTPDAEKAFRSLQAAFRDKYHVAVTFGFGPRYMHSTGQLHKGDAGKGYFIQFRSKSMQDIPIPETAGQEDSFITFDILKTAQAIGDAQALVQENRKVLAIELDGDPKEQIKDLTAKIQQDG
jgi:glucose-6-phosphate isomerase